VGLDPEKDVTILQLGTGTEAVSALEGGRISMAALTNRYAIPLLQRGWPMFVDLSTTDLVYPSSCVASSRNFVKAERKVVDDFLRAYVAAIQLIKKDQAFAEKTFAKWLRERDPYLIRKTVESYARLFKSPPYVPDKGIDTVLKDLASRRPVPKEFIGHPELFRDNNPLEKVLSKS
jgi:ABC-type nitrate/sulfonate/bicarbonate transport system substrate-binding protein